MNIVGGRYTRPQRLSLGGHAKFVCSVSQSSLGEFIGKKIELINAFNSDGDWTGPIKNRNVTHHPAEQDDPGLRDAAGAVVDDEVIGTPKSQCPGREIKWSLEGGQGRRQIAGLFLTEVVTHFDG